jgi:hypothetical protein
MPLGDLFSKAEDHFSFAFDNEQDYIRIVMYGLTELSHGWNTDDHQFAEGSCTDYLGECLVVSCRFFDVVMERQNGRFWVPSPSWHGHLLGPHFAHVANFSSLVGRGSSRKGLAPL